MRRPHRHIGRVTRKGRYEFGLRTGRRGNLAFGRLGTRIDTHRQNKERSAAVGTNRRLHGPRSLADRDTSAGALHLPGGRGLAGAPSEQRFCSSQPSVHGKSSSISLDYQVPPATGQWASRNAVSFLQCVLISLRLKDLPMAFRRADSVSTCGVGLVAALFFAASAIAADRESKLAG